MTTIVIGLAAVVVLILVVVLLAMRYLRADDGDDFDDIPAERKRARAAAADGARLAVPARTGRAPGRPAPAQARRGTRPGWDERDTHPGQRPSARRGEQRQQESLPDVQPRRSKRTDDEDDWPSTDWDSLSDVDYWAEVASEKPLTTTAQPAAQARPARAEMNGQGRQAQRRPEQGRADQGRPDQGRPGQDAGQRPRSTVQRKAARPAPPPGQRRPVPAAATPPQRPADYLPAPVTANGRAAAPAAGEPTLAMLASMGSRQRPPGRNDDDPLTSPSFPKVQDDSRSYRNGRPITPPAGSPVMDPATAGRGRVPSDPGPATQQFMAPALAAARADVYRPADHRQAGPPAGYVAPGGQDDPGGLPYPPASAGGYQRQHGHPAGNGRRHVAPAGPVPGAPASYDSAPGNPYDTYPGQPGQTAPRRPDGQHGSGPVTGPGGYPAAGRADRPYQPGPELMPQANGHVQHNGNGHGQYNGHSNGHAEYNGNGHQQQYNGSGPGWYPDQTASVPLPPADSGYPAGGPAHDGYHARYQGAEDYQTAAYPAPPYRSPRPAPADPYARDPYGSYPGYGAGGS